MNTILERLAALRDTPLLSEEQQEGDDEEEMMPAGGAAAAAGSNGDVWRGGEGKEEMLHAAVRSVLEGL